MRIYRKRQSKAQMIQAKARLMAQKSEYVLGSPEEIQCQSMIDRYDELIGA
ncbi:MAG: hypothetical protein K9N07_07590 [Candidatus Cloacimonetes bacterium]|nr:hypothetical protein [Candidatus Cloacimonadota bacterium]MCF8012810.1 hypothetical protein [Candidatus Woesearchaeota archaeon]